MIKLENAGFRAPQQKFQGSRAPGTPPLRPWQMHKMKCQASCCLLDLECRHCLKTECANSGGLFMKMYSSLPLNRRETMGHTMDYMPNIATSEE